MYITFVCVGMPFNGNTIAQGKSLGGSETACWALAQEMADRGHHVNVFTSDREEGEVGGVNYTWCGDQNERVPMGDRVHAFMEQHPQNVLIVQRGAGIHRKPPAADMVFWWLHDLALIRQVQPMRQDMYLYDGVFAVSDWHRNQIVDTWHLDKEHIHVLPNAVDVKSYQRAGPAPEIAQAPFGLTMLYQSRPERGIDYFLRPGGILEKLHQERPDAHLFVCGYDNTTRHMAQYYQQVWQRIEQLPNCSLLGPMGKAQLASVQKAVDVLVYPGEFEETSCITAMEAQAAGLPMIASQCGALEETCGPGAKLVPLKDGRCDADKFVKWLVKANPDLLNKMSRSQLQSAKGLSWSRSGDYLEATIQRTLDKKRKNVFSMTRSMLDRSDIQLLKYYNPLKDVAPELEEREASYSFDPAEQYNNDEAFEDILRDESVDVSGNARFETVCDELGRGGITRVLDYGCQKGHYTFTLAQRYPYAHFVGMDISPRVIEWANAKKQELGIENVEFMVGDVTESVPLFPGEKFDAVILGEVLEHVEEPVNLVDKLDAYVTEDCKFVVTTPFGCWEGKDYHSKPDADRYHLWHFERADLTEMFSHNDEFQICCVPAGESVYGPLGSWVVSFRAGEDQIAYEIDMPRKLLEFVPRQTVSLCMIVKDAETSLQRALLSAADIADEFIIGLDKNTSDDTAYVLNRFKEQHCKWKRFEVFEIDSPLEIGFDAARNLTINQARGDWIMWIDSDEEVIHPDRLHKYIRNNRYDGYGIAQNHYSADPIGVLNTDWPVRLFRNVDYLRFHGFVHEHPDDLENLNTGPRRPGQLMDAQIKHDGYKTEMVRRARFRRNLPLIREDRKRNPDRQLGRFLWMRDLAHLAHFELEATRGVVTQDIREYAEEGLKIWDELVQIDNPAVKRMLRDGIEFYSTLVQVIGNGFEAEVQLHASKANGGADSGKGPRRKGRFRNRNDFEKYMALCYDEQLEGFDSKYL